MSSRKMGLEKKAASKESYDAEQARKAELRVRNNTLLSMSDFRQFLRECADRAGYFNATCRFDEWYAGYTAAMRDVVNGVVVNSDNGSDFLSNYLAERRNKKGTEK